MRIFNKSIIVAIMILTILTAVGIYGVSGYSNVITSASDLSKYTRTVYPITASVASVDKQNEVAIQYKAFNTFDVLQAQAKVFEDDSVYLGGIPLGLAYGTEGVIVIREGFVITDEGKKYPALNCGLQSNDIIFSLNGKSIGSITDLEKVLSSYKSGTMRGEARRNNSVIEFEIIPQKDSLTNKYKLGIYVKDGVDGIGTLTFVRKDNMRYGTLGHKVSDIEIGRPLQLSSGSIYPAYVIGIQSSKRGKAGELRGMFVKQNVYGSIDKNCSFGTYGVMTQRGVNGLTSIKVGSKNTIKRGKAHIYTTIDGKTPNKYEIEIIKLKSQNKAEEKSILFRVTDKELLRQTGGILQGMSGSPIVQNDRLVGAVTHVTLAQAEMGYGLYIDWMIEN